MTPFVTVNLFFGDLWEFLLIREHIFKTHSFQLYFRCTNEDFDVRPTSSYCTGVISTWSITLGKDVSEIKTVIDQDNLRRC